MSRCRSCGAPIRWETTSASGKPIPLDPEPRADGNLAVLPDGRVGSPAGQEPGPRYVSHFATCPNATKHRKQPPTKEEA